MAGEINVARRSAEDHHHDLVDGRAHGASPRAQRGSRRPGDGVIFIHSFASTESAVMRASVNKSPLR